MEKAEAIFFLVGLFVLLMLLLSVAELSEVNRFDDVFVMGLFIIMVAAMDWLAVMVDAGEAHSELGSTFALVLCLGEGDMVIEGELFLVVVVVVGLLRRLGGAGPSALLLVLMLSEDNTVDLA